jgi:hypothetical protein
MMGAWIGKKMPSMEKLLPLPGDSKTISADTMENMKSTIAKALEQYKNGRNKA